ncbi:hypothetical protein AKJ48_01785 [candidate division MSBL1 archaeon SCGC-AAA261O19]|uniref:Hydrogenase maturation factor HypA n=2 Tax=candidate division MSBL1 TaxID=215777 RepID=A0A133UZX6_9EURY|nr:hypothetical protein AKJ42_02585 [candidate division MSBL1 archaeon SCGC-AAA261C02]KXB04666.1 hypothetical protein AKJ48_01785 [candidate division MSBL1 archaeon SCGC-AAA261O19]
MHEVKIAEKILGTLRNIAEKHQARVVKANLRIGELNEPDGVLLWLKKLGGKEFESTEFEITRVPIRVSCECGYTGRVESVAHYHGTNPELHIACPKCGGHDFSLTSGQEKEIVDVELEGEADE